jgi:hypothetical protein
MSQPHLSNNLDKIIQMISIEQLLGLMKQMKSNCDADTNINANININTDVLSLPIVKNVINAYEQEIKALNATTTSATNAATNNTNIIPFASEITKITEQLDKINNNLLVIVEKINSMESDFKSLQNNKQVTKLNDDEEHIVLKIEERDIKENDVFESINIADDDCESECSDDEFIKEIKASLAMMEKAEIEDEVVSEVEEKELEEEVVSEEEESAQAIEEEVEAQAIVVSEEAQAIEEEELEEEEEEEEEEDDTEPEISDDSDEDVKEVSKVVEQVKQEEEEEEEVFEIEIDDVTYYATHEENGILYEVDKDGEVGKKVGIIKDGEPIFS